jgi:hypothetical protein
MSDQSDLEGLMGELNAIPANEVEEPSIPVHYAVSEALTLKEVATRDKAALAVRKLDFSLVESLGIKARALRAAESNLLVATFGTNDLADQFFKLVKEASDLREELTHEYSYAFHDIAPLTKAVQDIIQGSGYPDLVQDMANSNGLGVKNADLLMKAGVDMKKVERAGELATELGDLLAKTTVEKLVKSPEKTIRDRAFTYMNKSVEIIRACGKSVFWKDPQHAALYASAYLRKQRRKAERKKKNGGDAEKKA